MYPLCASSVSAARDHGLRGVQHQQNDGGWARGGVVVTASPEHLDFPTSLRTSQAVGRARFPRWRMGSGAGCGPTGRPRTPTSSHASQASRSPTRRCARLGQADGVDERGGPQKVKALLHAGLRQTLRLTAVSRPRGEEHEAASPLQHLPHGGVAPRARAGQVAPGGSRPRPS